METKRDIEEALTIFDQLREEDQKIALARLWEIAPIVCNEASVAV